MLQTVTVFPKEILAATACKSVCRSIGLHKTFWLISRATPPEVLSRPELLCSTVYPLKDIWNNHSGEFPAKLKHMVGKDGLKVKALPDLLGSHVRSIIKSCHPC